MATTELNEAPALGRLYLKAALPTPNRGDGLPDDTLVLRDVAVDRAHLAEYNRVCGYRLRDALPPTYPHIVAFPLAVSLMTAPAFPFALPGLVHIANRIDQRRGIDTGERLSFAVQATDLRPHAKGRQFDVVATVTAGEETVWVEHSTYLKRGGGDGSDATSAAPGAESAAVDSPGAGTGAPAAVWRVGADRGRRYAAVSGDRNPIHLHPLPARLFGFPRAIAHGMWTKARCLAALEGRVPDRMSVDVRFAKPVLLPTQVTFTHESTSDGLTFALRDQRSGAPHVDGRITR